MGALIGVGFASTDTIVWTPKLVTQTSPGDATGKSGYTVLVKFPTTFVVQGLTYFRVTLIGPVNAANSTVFDNVTVSNAATSGDAFDSAAAPVACLFGGSASLSLQAGQVRTSDRVTFSASGAITVGFNVSASPIAGTVMALRKSSPSGPTLYEHSALAEAGTANRTSTGWSSNSGRSNSITKLEFA